MPLLGSQIFANKQWTPGVKISGMHSPAEEWVVDTQLPPIGTDPRYPSTDQIVISRGSLIAVRPDTTSYTGRAVLTIADGTTNNVAGYTETNIFRQWQDRAYQMMPSMSRHEFIEVPYITAINGAYGQLAAGNKITAYFGSVTQTSGIPVNKGKIVKWVPKTQYCLTVAASSSVALASANLPAFTPTVQLVFNTSTLIASGNAVVPVWNVQFACWVVTFGDTVTTILYTVGQGADQIAGEVIRVEPISAAHHLSGWLEWVTDNFLAWEYPPQLLRVPTTAVTAEVPATIGTNWYRLANFPVASWQPINVYLTGTVVDPSTGIVTTYTGTPMSLSDTPFLDNSMGQYYNINVTTGDLYFGNNVVVNSVTVDYSYETSYRDGRLFNPGITGLTDGKFSGVPGTPANLEVANVVGSLRCLIY